MARPTTSPATNFRTTPAPQYYQQLMFSPAGHDREKYNPLQFRTLLRKHLNDRSKKAKLPQRNPDAGRARVRSGLCAGELIAAARAGAAGRGVSP